MPKFSIIIPVYNVEKYLNQCVDSVLNQSFSDFEIILVDDGSPDNCPQICDEYAEKDNRVKVIHKENGGVSAARNSGIEISSGEFIWFVDSDDYIMENALTKISDRLSESTDIFGFNRLPLLYYDNKIKDISNLEFSFDKEQLKELINYSHSNNILPYPWRYVYKASLIKDNEMRFDEKMRYGEDSVFNTEAFLRAENVEFIGERLYFYRQRDDAVSKIISKSFDFRAVEQMTLGINLREEIYNKLCEEPNDAFYEDMSKFILTTVFFIILLKRVYKSRNKNKFIIFKSISKEKILKNAFKRFDINKIKSKSLDWWVLWTVKHKLYFAGHLICRYFLYK